jgi:hypothetical protein
MPPLPANLDDGVLRHPTGFSLDDDADGTHVYQHDPRADFEALEPEVDASVKLGQMIESVGVLPHPRPGRLAGAEGT